MHDCPAFAMADHIVASTARLTSASAATITGSLPPHSRTTGTITEAHCAATSFAVRVEPVNESLSIPLTQSAPPVSPKPVIVVKISAKGATSLKLSSNHIPTPGVYSLGLKTTVFPAASAYEIEPIGVKIG
ncbi:unannotated protein [freshwater metagenome]|uniref:Unannotated protein n=1 Tax=freshwater metagenome TaxID=449393 RepID=A0A6J6FPX6_9ZZZZ